MCRVCDIVVHESKLLREGDYCNLYLERDKYFYYIVGKADGNAILMIKYCPICGRELEKEECEWEEGN